MGRKRNVGRTAAVAEVAVPLPAMAATPSSDGHISKAAVTALAAALAPMPPEVIRQRAYEKWEKAGRPAGDGVRFWLEAERELLQSD